MSPARAGRVALARAPRVVAALALVLASALGPAGAARAQTSSKSGSTSSSSPTVGVTLVSQSSWVPLGGVFSMTLRLDPRVALTPDVAVAVTVHRPTTSRSSFDAAVQGSLGRSQSDLTIPVATIPRDASGNLVVRFGLTGSDVSPRAFVSSRTPGVYPMEVGLTNTEETGSFVTWLVTVDGDAHPAISQRLQVAFVWQLTAPPASLPSGSTDRRVVSQMEPGGRLDHVASVLNGAGALPYSLVLGPETVESWARLARGQPNLQAGLARVRTAAARSTTQLLPAAYVPIDGTALEAEGLGDHLPDEFLAGSQALERVVGRSVDTGTVFVDPADDASVDRQRSMLSDRVVVRDSELVPVSHPFTPAQTFQLTTGGGSMQAATTAPFIETLMDGHDAPAVKAQRVLAGLSEVAYETPAISRGLVIAPSADWSPDVSAMTILANALRNHPLLQPATLDELFSRVAPEQSDDQTLERQLQPGAPGRQPISSIEYNLAASQLASYRAVVGADDPGVVAGEQSLLVALSTSISSARARAELAKINTTVQRFTSGVTTSSRRITLTARRAEVPLSFLNTTKQGRVQVKVHLDSAKLTFPNGPDRILTLPPGNTTVRFSVEARASGTFPMTVTLTSADGTLGFGAPTRLTVRSAVFGGWAIALTIGALAFLAFWWGNHFWRSRRSRRAAVPVGAS